MGARVVVLVRNQTSLAAEGIVDLDGQAHERWLIVVKACFVLTGSAPRPMPTTVERAERFLPDGALACPSDFRPERVGTDVILAGTAVAPKVGATAFDASLELEGRLVKLRCNGPRAWERHGTELRMSHPGPVDRVPLTAAMAFGGAGEPRNRAGRGRPIAVGAEEAGVLLPQIEWADDLVTSAAARPEPALVAGIASHCESRLRLAGTYDAAWTRNRAPLPPVDRAPGYASVAPSRLAFSPALTGGGSVMLENLGRAGSRSLALPRVIPRLLFEGTWVAMSLDLIVLDVDADTVALTFGASLDIAGRLDDRLVVDVTERRVVPLGERGQA